MGRLRGRDGKILNRLAKKTKGEGKRQKMDLTEISPHHERSSRRARSVIRKMRNLDTITGGIPSGGGEKISTTWTKRSDLCLLLIENLRERAQGGTKSGGLGGPF